MKTNSVEIPDFTREVLKLKVSCSFWDGKMASEAAAEAAAKAEGAALDRVEAKILALERKALSPITGPMAKMKTLWRVNSRPWEDGGWRLVKSKDYPALKEGLEKLQREVRDGVREIVQKRYAELKAEAEKELNGLIKDRFPSKEQMMDRYDVRIFVDILAPMSTNPIPGMNQKDLEALIKSRENYYREKIEEGNKALLVDIKKTVKDLSLSLEQGKAFQGTPETGFPIFDNVRSMLDRCEYLNITEDPGIKGTIEKIRKTLDSIDPELVRTDKLARKDATQKTKSILASLGS